VIVISEPADANAAVTSRVVSNETIVRRCIAFPPWSRRTAQRSDDG
jgi:hypothetical protein